jgi:hypothetical protein
VYDLVAETLPTVASGNRSGQIPHSDSQQQQSSRSLFAIAIDVLARVENDLGFVIHILILQILTGILDVSPIEVGEV